MLFIGPDDFFRKVSHIPSISRERELYHAKKMLMGDMQAKESIILGYLPYIASFIRHQPSQNQTLELILRCCIALEKAVDSFDFLQNSEPFSHRLDWYLRQTATAYMADRYSR